MAEYIGNIPHHVIAVDGQEAQMIVRALYEGGFDELAEELDDMLFDGEWSERCDCGECCGVPK